MKRHVCHAFEWLSYIDVHFGGAFISRCIDCGAYGETHGMSVERLGQGGTREA